MYIFIHHEDKDHDKVDKTEKENEGVETTDDYGNETIEEIEDSVKITTEPASPLEESDSDNQINLLLNCISIKDKDTIKELKMYVFSSLASNACFLVFQLQLTCPVDSVYEGSENLIKIVPDGCTLFTFHKDDNLLLHDDFFVRGISFS